MNQKKMMRLYTIIENIHLLTMMVEESYLRL